MLGDSPNEFSTPLAMAGQPSLLGQKIRITQIQDVKSLSPDNLHSKLSVVRDFRSNSLKKSHRDDQSARPQVFKKIAGAVPQDTETSVQQNGNRSIDKNERATIQSAEKAIEPNEGRQDSNFDSILDFQLLESEFVGTE